MDSASNMWFSNKYLQKYQYQYQNIELRITPSVLKKNAILISQRVKKFQFD
jgi:hypothetical protein